MEENHLKHVFGPVPSRRLGRSLGVDLIPYKTCTYNCVYCQIGRTTACGDKRSEWFPMETVLAEIAEGLEREPDYITISGSGEPTLYSRLGELIGQIKKMTTVPVAVITNGSLLWDPKVRAELAEADLVVPSLDAGTESTFKLVNRPCEGITFDKMVQGLIDFSHEYKGQLWLEVFLVEGMSANEDEVAEIVKICSRIRTDRIQLNTVVRPPAEVLAEKVSKKKMMALAEMFTPPAEVIADYEGTWKHGGFEGHRDDVLELLKRRPCTVADIVVAFRMHRNEVVKYVDMLVDEGKITSSVQEDAVYYRAN